MITWHTKRVCLNLTIKIVFQLIPLPIRSFSISLSGQGAKLCLNDCENKKEA